MNIIESRATLIMTYLVPGIAALSALFPIALMALNALKSKP